MSQQREDMRILSEHIAELIGSWELTHNTLFSMCWMSDGGEYYIRWRIRNNRKWINRFSQGDDPAIASLMQPLLAAAVSHDRVLSQVCQAENNGRILVYTLDTKKDPPLMEYMAIEPTYNLEI